VADARSSRRKGLTNAAITVVAALAGVVFLNILLHGCKHRVDLSGDGLTRASELLVQGLDEPIRVTAYLGRVPTENAFEQEFVESLLDQYANAPDSKLTWTKIDPFERGREFQQTLKTEENIAKLNWLSLIDDTPQQVPVYFHVQFKYLDKTEVWSPQRQFSLKGLEYEFSSIIKRLGYPKKRIGVTTGFGSPPQAQGIQAILSSHYDVTMVDLTQADTDLSQLDVLIVNGPTQPISETAKLAIDQHVLQGKATLFLIRGMSFTGPQTQPGMPPPPDQPYIGMPAQSGLDELLRNYGVTAASSVVLDQRVSTAGAVFVGQDGILVKELFPLAEVIANGESDPLAGMSLIPMPFASPVRLVDGFDSSGTIRAIELARTSPSSYEHVDMLVITKEADLSRKSQPAGPFPVGYALEGPFPSVTAAAIDTGDTGDTGATAPSGTRIIVLGSADIVDDMTLTMAQRHPLFRNLTAGASVLQNLVDWLAQDQSLVAARSKGAPPPIDPLDASGRTAVKWGTTAGTAVALLLIGLIGYFVRERRRRNFTL